MVFDPSFGAMKLAEKAIREYNGDKPKRGGHRIIPEPHHKRRERGALYLTGSDNF